jgi:hypothetical protein
MPAHKPISERLADLSMPEPNTGCWIWIGHVDRCGYGKVGSVDGESLAHRASFKTFVGPIRDGFELHHRCRERSCINPDHLQQVRHADNVAAADYTKNHRNGRKRRCKRGHPFTPENTIIKRSNGAERRNCRTCAREQKRRTSVER